MTGRSIPATARVALIVGLLATAVTAACRGDSVSAPAPSAASLQIEAASDTSLDGTVGQPVDSAPVVTVRNAAGQPVRGVTVAFVPTFADSGADVGSVTPGAVVTDARGQARPAQWRLGRRRGAYRLKARIVDRTAYVPGADRVVTFEARAKADAPVALTVVSGDGQVGLPGEPISGPLVQVTDRFGNPVAGSVTVTFTTFGGGSVDRPVGVAANGYAFAGTWTLGPAGLDSVVASAPGFASVTVTARTLDAGRVTWYDLADSPWTGARATLALGDKGIFELNVALLYDIQPLTAPDLPARTFGTYTVTGTTYVLTPAEGESERGTLAGDTLTIAHTFFGALTPASDLRVVRRR